MRKIPAVSEMEHITSKEFGENMDAILERVAKEDVALIIDHEDKSYVLCPARWFEGPELTQLEVMVKNAVRYVSEVDDSDLAETARTVKELAPILSPACITTLLKIIMGKISDGCGGAWREMKQALEDVLAMSNKERETQCFTILQICTSVIQMSFASTTALLRTQSRWTRC